jgi:hypothetical protein
MGVSMNIRFIVLCLALPFSLRGSGPLVNRYIPSFCMMSTDRIMSGDARPVLTATLSAGHASKGSPLFDQSQEMYRFDGLLEMDGWYDLHELVASAKEAVPGFVSPFVRETGGSALAARQLLFGAQSSISLYGLDIAARVPLRHGFACGVSVPLWHVEARQRYQFPVAAADQTITESIPQIEQAHRFRQMVHTDLGMMQKDWISNVIGDVSGWIEYVKTWSRVWLLRTIQCGGRVSVSAPTGAKSDTRYPASFNVGNGGGWGISYSLLPRFEVREGIWVQLPFTVTGQTPSQHIQRLPVYAESPSFGALIAPVKNSPGVSISCEPSLTFQHFIDNLHLSFGFSWLKHYSDTLVDTRKNPLVESYLTRKTIPEGSFGATARYNDAQRMLSAQRNMKKSYTGWNRMYLLFAAQYELCDLFPRVRYAPLLHLGIHYCISNSHAAKLHQVTTGLSWRF